MGKKKLFKLISNIIILLSMIFVLVFLYKHGLLRNISIRDYRFFGLSILFLLLGFLFEPFILKYFLLKNGIKISYHASLIITGKYILAKYIPGKFGVVLGKSVDLKQFTNTPGIYMFILVFVFQMIIVASAVILTFLFLSNFIGVKYIGIIYIILLIFMSVAFFNSKWIQNKFFQLLFKITKIKETHEYSISPNSIINSTILTSMCWLSWSIGFWLLGQSFGLELKMINGLLFPLASVAGIVAIISPGGLGVREGIILSGLIFFGLPENDSINLSVVSRLWFLIGEVFMFVSAVLLSVIFKRRYNETFHK